MRDRNLSKWKERQVFFTLSIIATLILASIYVLVYSWPRYEERFIAMGILGRNKRAEDYYPANGTIIKVGDLVLWHIYIYNHWDKIQNVSIRIKILNSTMPSPDDNNNEPSPIPPVSEIRLLLSENETRLIPFLWHIEEAVIHENEKIIKKLVINDETVSPNVYGNQTSLFRIIFELWLFNAETGEFEYGWYQKNVHYVVWNGIWFNATLPT